MSIALITRGMVSLGGAAAVGGVPLSPTEHPVLSVVELKPEIVSGFELKPEVYAAEDQADTNVPFIASVQELKPEISGTIDLRPEIVSAEEEE